MQMFPHSSRSQSCPSVQVQKNCLLALCSEFILQDVPFDKLVCLRRSHIVNPGGGQDNQCSNSAACSLEQIGVQLKYFSTQKAKAKRKFPLQRQYVEISLFHSIFFCPVPHVACSCSRFRYLAATLVINWLSSHEDPTLQRMAVAVISVLVAKVKTALALCALASSIEK